MTDQDKTQTNLELAGGQAGRRGGASTAEKIALGIGAAAAVGVATGLLIARQSAKAMRKYIVKDDGVPKEYWQLDYVRDAVQHTRYFHGTEAAVQRRIKHIQGEEKDLKLVDQAQAEELAQAQKTHIIKVI